MKSLTGARTAPSFLLDKVNNSELIKIVSHTFTEWYFQTVFFFSFFFQFCVEIIQNNISVILHENFKM